MPVYTPITVINTKKEENLHFKQWSNYSIFPSCAQAELCECCVKSRASEVSNKGTAKIIGFKHDSRNNLSSPGYY